MTVTPIKSPSIAQKLKEISDHECKVSFSDFMQTALFHPEDGYYTKVKNRVGRESRSDFFTSSSFKNLFAQILIESTSNLLESSNQRPADFTWVEIGAEPNKALLDSIEHPFRGAETIRVGTDIKLKGKLIVFSNELFDAQPCHSLVFDEEVWKERFVQINDEGISFQLGKIKSPGLTPYLAKLPKLVPQGYTIDIPTGADALAGSILQQDWKGLFVAFDYGKTWKSLIHDTPQGSARAYKEHRQVTDLLADAGDQDLTCHICWDNITDTVERHGFSKITLESQESYIIKRAPRVMQEAFNPANDAFSKQRSQLRQLIHPTLMGQKFQAISAVKF
ncbi:SAM-dependent methyltransferase [Puniceicoccaceae bacterium K14]|nr:SAM-dependent methyltransferase [Puniceicoccaceae bacterium K14]